jgi:hypothetical protein
MFLSSQVAEPAHAVVLNRIGAPTKTGKGVQSTSSGRSGAAAVAEAGVAKARSSARLRVIASGLSGIVTGVRFIIVFSVRRPQFAADSMCACGSKFRSTSRFPTIRPERVRSGWAAA